MLFPLAQGGRSTDHAEDVRHGLYPAEKLPSSLDEIDSFINKATAEEHDVQKKVAKRLRQESEPYNSVYACEIDEVSPQRGEVIRMRDHSSIAASAGGT